MRLTLPATMLLAATLASSPAMADTPRPNDEIVLQLSTEGWVDTKSARITAVVQKVLSGDEAANTGDRVPTALNELAPGAEWHVVRFDRSRDESGLERWRITAEARLPESELGGIYDRARNLSQPGQQIQIADVDFTPTLEEREAAAAELRAAIYREAQAEVKRVAEAFPEAGYRVTRVDFVFSTPTVRPYAQDMVARAAPMAMQAAESKMADQGVSERMVLNATVTIGAPPPADGDENDRR